jgi:hypothetical protein
MEFLEDRLRDTPEEPRLIVETVLGSCWPQPSQPDSRFRTGARRSRGMEWLRRAAPSIEPRMFELLRRAARFGANARARRRTPS